MDFKLIKDLLDLIEHKPFKRIEISDKEGFSINIENYDSTMPIIPVSSKVDVKDVLESTDVQYSIIRSPMVGIVHLNTNTTEIEVISVGKHIKKGEILCSIEAMKLMNDLESDIDGIVEKIYVSNGDTVEYGTPLFKIKK